MINTAIRHSVTDYGKWKSVYDTFLPTIGRGEVRESESLG